MGNGEEQSKMKTKNTLPLHYIHKRKPAFKQDVEDNHKNHTKTKKKTCRLCNGIKRI